MLNDLLKLFPEKAYPLILAHDPDGLLNEESVLAALNGRGFTLIHEADPAHLRHRAENSKPFSIDTPIIIRTENLLNTLPFDLWQQGHHISLGLNTFFPNLTYPVLKQLTPNQIWRLGQSTSPFKRVGQRGTMDFVLIIVFELDLSGIETIEDWVIWLSTYHQNWDSSLLAEPTHQAVIEPPPGELSKQPHEISAVFTLLVFKLRILPT